MWERTAQARPGRIDIFNAFSEELASLNCEAPEILELGSGPGFLAAHFMDALPNLRITLLDFSDAMHELARRRLSNRLERVQFITRDFRDSAWNSELADFDAVITNQSAHELRHKRYAEGFHAQAKNLLRPGAPYLMSDHFLGDGGLGNDKLYLTIDEHRQALTNAAYNDVRQVISTGSLVMYRAELAKDCH